MQGKADETECPRSLAGRHRRQRKISLKGIQNLSGMVCGKNVRGREVMVPKHEPAMPTDARLTGLQELSCAACA